jgi:hypothetical protein
MTNGFQYLWVEVGRNRDTSTLYMDLPNGGRLYRYHNGRQDVMVYVSRVEMTPLVTPITHTNPPTPTGQPHEPTPRPRR